MPKYISHGIVFTRGKPLAVNYSINRFNGYKTHVFLIANFSLDKEIKIF